VLDAYLEAITPRTTSTRHPYDNARDDNKYEYDSTDTDDTFAPEDTVAFGTALQEESMQSVHNGEKCDVGGLFAENLTRILVDKNSFALVVAEVDIYPITF
jgi:hypothetical protein